MSKEELKLNDKELHKCIDELKGTQFLSAFYILDWIIKMRNENKELQERINKAIEFIHGTEYQYGDLEQDSYDYNMCFNEVEDLLKILKGED